MRKTVSGNAPGLRQAGPRPGVMFMNALPAASSMLWELILPCAVIISMSPPCASLQKARGATLRAELAGYIGEKATSFKPFWVPPAAPADETEKVNLQQMEGGEVAISGGYFLRGSFGWPWEKDVGCRFWGGIIVSSFGDVEN